MEPREGMAFISVGMPAHYAAISAVLEEIKHRFEPEWEVQEVLDFGSKSGTGFWYVDWRIYHWRDQTTYHRAAHKVLGDIKHYVGVDSRVGLSELAKELLRTSEKDRATKLSFVRKWGKVRNVLPIPPILTYININRIAAD
jgi:ribosomal protein RSM22 (predicted rRNA methylase)